MKALVVVDIQNDFLPGGALPVPEGDKIIFIVNNLIDIFDLVFATQDWHPQDHGSFASSHPGKSPGDIIQLNGLNQVLWPVHCIQDSPGAAFSSMLHTHKFRKVFVKGTDPQIDSYSGFFDNGHRKSTGMSDFLNALAVTDLTIVGLAADYCVKFTALDAVAGGFKTTVLDDATKAVNLQKGDFDKAMNEMRAAGVNITDSHKIIP